MMRLQTLLLALLILLAGWWLGWYSHDRFSAGPEPVIVRQPLPALRTESPVSTTSVSAETGQARKQAGALADMLKRQEYSAAMEYFAVLQQSPGDALAGARTQILKTAHGLIENGRLEPAEDLLQQFIVMAHRDVDAHRLLARTYFDRGDLRAAIEQLYTARGYAYRAETLQAITVSIRAWVAELDARLKRSNDTVGLLSLFQYLEQQEPDYAPYFLRLAETQMAIDDLVAAQRSLSLITQDPSVGGQARNLLGEINRLLVQRQGVTEQETAATVTGVPLRRSGNHFIVAGTPLGTHSVQLLIDTGASLTILAPAVFERRGIRYQDTGQTRVFQTANGPVRAPVYRLAVLTIGDWQVNGLEVGVLDLGRDAVFDGLLGMNFLNQFRFFIDQNESLLMLTAD